MGILFVLNASQGFIIAIQHVGVNWVTQDTLIWRRLAPLRRFRASSRTLDAWEYESECQYILATCGFLMHCRGWHSISNFRVFFELILFDLSIGFRFLWIYVIESWYVGNASRKCNMTWCLKLQPYRGIDSNLQRRILYHACVAQSGILVVYILFRNGGIPPASASWWCMRPFY